MPVRELCIYSPFPSVPKQDKQEPECYCPPQPSVRCAHRTLLLLLLLKSSSHKQLADRAHSTVEEVKVVGDAFVDLIASKFATIINPHLALAKLNPPLYRSPTCR